MADSLLRVTDEQIAAAQLRLVLDEKLGRQTPELVQQIALMTGAERDERKDISSHAVGVAEAPAQPTPDAHETDCREVLAEAWQLLDNEIEPERHELLKRHLDECDSCLEDVGLKEHLKALLALKGGGDHASDSLRQRLRESIREIILRQAVLGANDFTVERVDDDTIVKVRLAATESRGLPRKSNL